MSSQPALNPYGGGTALVDRLIGDAYPVVKNVYDNMEYVKAVGEAIKSTSVGEPFVALRRVTVSGGSGGLGTTNTVPFDDLDMTLDKIISSSVKIIGTDGAMYFEDSGAYSSKVTNLGLVFSLKSTAPAACANAVLEWFMIYEG